MDDVISDRGLVVAIIGASGNTGRQIALSLISRRKNNGGLADSMTVQFVGMREDHSLGIMIGLCSELRDAFEEYCPHLEVVVDLEAVKADIIIMAAGASLSHKYKTFSSLAQANMDIFDYHAGALLEKNADSIIVITANPAEFAVECFVAAGFREERVLACGAFLDTLRFRRELASELGVSRQHLSGLVLGKHGLDMVPCWSTVQPAPHLPRQIKDELAKLKEEGLNRLAHRTKDNTDNLRQLAYEIRELAEAHNVLEAASKINVHPPDVRAVLRRYVSFFAGPTYPRIGIGEIVAQLVLDLMEGRAYLCSAQVMVQGQFLGIKDQAIGAPVIISNRGARPVAVELHEIEKEAILAAAHEAMKLSRAVKALKFMREKRKRKVEAKT